MTTSSRPSDAKPTATGPRTAAGKAVSARNATTHGLFCRQTVLPHLGEDPQAYKRLLDALHEQLRPRNLMETQYLELWADASWKLRRLSRLEAETWEDDALEDEARLCKLERLSRLQSGLRRQLDKAVRMLAQEVPGLFAQRTREDVMAKMYVTETLCAESPFRQKDVEQAVQAHLRWPAPPDDLAAALDNTPPADADSQNRQNEPAPCTGIAENSTGMACHAPTNDAPTPSSPCSDGEAARNEPEGVLTPERVLDAFCQNEPVPAPNYPLPEGEVSWLANSEGSPHPPVSGGTCDRGTREQGSGSRRAERRRGLQELEDLLNSGTLTKDECRNLLMGESIPGFNLGDGRIEIHKG